MNQIFATNSRFHVRLRTTGKVQLIFLSDKKFSFGEENWVLDTNSMMSQYFTDIYYFPKMLIS